MGRGKLILICQSGGHFTAKDDGTLSYNGGEANAVEISCETQFNDLKQKLAQLCDFEIGSVTVKYFLPQNKRTAISLTNDRDLKRMYDFHGDSVTADVFVTGLKGFVPEKAQTPEGRSVIKEAETVASTEPNQEASKIASPRRRTRGSASRKTPKKPVAREDSESDTTDKPPSVPPEPIEVDLAATPADTVKKRRRAATNGSTHTDEEDEEERGKRGRMNFQFLDDSVEGEGGEIHQIQVFSDRPMDELVASWKDAITGVGQEFNSVADFRDALQKYAIANRFGYRLKKNDAHRASGRCVIENCSWKIHASRVSASASFTIKKMVREHSCGGESWKAAHPAKNWLVSVIKERLRDSPSHKPKEIASSIFRDFGLELNYTQVWRGMEDARQQLQGSYKDVYSQLPLFCQKLVEANPGSTATFFSGEDDRFRRLFVAFQASIHGFSTCRPLIFLESTYSKSKHHEMLFTASAIDGDDGIFPIAFAVVDVETVENWRWFLEELKPILDSNPVSVTFVSDMEKGLKKLVAEVFENSHHGYSIHHLLESFKREMKGPFQGDGRASLPSLLLSAAHALRPDSFTRQTEQIRRVSSRTHDWVLQTGPENWAAAHFIGERYNYVTYDVSEMYSKWVHDMRDQNILRKVESFVAKMADLMHTRKVKSSEWVVKLTPSYQLKIQESSSKAHRLKVLFSTETLFEVHDDSNHVVDLNKEECTCLVWKATGFPCAHAIAVFNCTRRNLYDYCPKYFTAETYRDTYLESVNPVPVLDENGGGEEGVRTVLPPLGLRPVSFSKQPRKEGKVKLREVTCSRCHGIGHNKATCKEPIDGAAKEERLLMLTSSAQGTALKGGEGQLMELASANDPMEQETALNGGGDSVEVQLALENGPTEHGVAVNGGGDSVKGQLPSENENDSTEQGIVLKREGDLVDRAQLEVLASTNDPMEQETPLNGGVNSVEVQLGLENGPTEHGVAVNGGGDSVKGQLPSENENDSTEQGIVLKREGDLVDRAQLEVLASTNDPMEQETPLNGGVNSVEVQLGLENGPTEHGVADNGGGDSTKGQLPSENENGPTEQGIVSGEGDLVARAQLEVLASTNDPMEQETALKGGEDLADSAVGPTEGEEGLLESLPSANDPMEQEAVLKGGDNLAGTEQDSVASANDPMEQKAAALKGGEEDQADVAVGPTEENTVSKGEEGSSASPNDPMEQETALKGGEDVADVAVGPTEPNPVLKGEGDSSASPNDPMEQETALKGGVDLADAAAVGPMEENTALNGDEGQPEEPLPSVNDLMEEEKVGPTEENPGLKGKEGLETEAMELEKSTHQESRCSDKEGDPTEQGTVVPEGGELPSEVGRMEIERDSKREVD